MIILNYVFVGKVVVFSRFIAIFGQKYGSRPNIFFFFCENAFLAIDLKEGPMTPKPEGGGG